MSRPRALTPEQARELVRLVKLGNSDTLLAQRYGVSAKTVSDIRCGRAYTEETGMAPLNARVGRRRRVSDEQAVEILTRFRAGIPRLRIAREFGVTRDVVDRIVTGRGYTDATKIIQPPSPSPEGIVATRNLASIRRVSGPVECVDCQRRLRRTVASVEKCAGVTRCKTCEGRQ